MDRLQFWAISLPLSAIVVFALLCLTVTQFREGVFRIYFEAPGGIKLEADVDKGGSDAENRLLTPPENDEVTIQKDFGE